MSRFALSLAAGLLSSLTLAAQAVSIPYGNIGAIAPQSKLTAAATGNITGYFVMGGAASHGGASFTDTIRLFDATTSTYSAFLFNNQTTTTGTSANFGHVNAGDTLVFELYDQNINETFATDALHSADGVNHGYATAFSGGVLNGANIPAGTYIGMEDLDKSNSDFNYNDDTFVFTNVAATPTPEPSSLILLGSGILSAAGAVRRRFSAAS